MTARALDPSWAECQRDFHPDGSLRDIYVEEASRVDWKRFVDWLRSSTYRLSFRHAGNPMPMPTSAREIFVLSRAAASTLTIQTGPLSINCHFFSDDEIEMDLDPKELMDDRSFALLLEFIRGLGDTLGRDAIVTHENWKEAVLLRYTVRTRAIEREALG